MQVQQIDGVKTIYQALSHTAENAALKEAISHNITDNALTVFFNTPLCPTDKFYVICLKGLEVIIKWFSINPFIILNEISNKS